MNGEREEKGKVWVDKGVGRSCWRWRWAVGVVGGVCSWGLR